MQSRIRLSLTHLDTTATARNLTIPLSFILPISTLYILHPNSFQTIWKGRAPYFFFLYLFFLVLFIAWKKLPKKMFSSFKWRKTLAIAATMAAPTVYVITAYVFGMSHGIIEIGKLLGAGRYGSLFLKDHWPLSLEYLLLTAFFTASILFMYGIKGLKRFLIPLFFLGATGFFYMIDTFYPYGNLMLLQSFVPFTAWSATVVLGWMGYGTRLFSFRDGSILLAVAGPHGGASWYLYWPSAGIHSFLIYTLVILLFIKDAPFSPQRKVIYAFIPSWLKFVAKSKRIPSLSERKIICTLIMAAETFIVNVLRMVPFYMVVAIGAVGTFIANVLRIAYVCTIGSDIGEDAGQLFHSYYGELYFIAWTVIYLMMILLLSRRIWTRLSMLRSKPSVT